MKLIIESITDVIDENGDPGQHVATYGFDDSTEALQVVVDYVAADKLLSRDEVAKKIAQAKDAGIDVKGAEVFKEKGASPTTVKDVLFNRCYVQLFIPSTDANYGALAVGQVLDLIVGDAKAALADAVAVAVDAKAKIG